MCADICVVWNLFQSRISHRKSYLQQHCVVSIIERQPSENHGIQNHTHRPHIGKLRIVGYALQNFRRSVGVATAEGFAQYQVAAVVLQMSPGKSEVGHFYVVSGIHEEILALYVSAGGNLKFKRVRANKSTPRERVARFKNLHRCHS